MAQDADPVGRLPDEWRAFMSARGARPFHGDQVFRWIHTRSIMDPHHMTDLPKALRQRLADEGLASPLALQRVHPSADGTRKLVLQAAGAAAIETVLLLSGHGEDADAGAASDDDDDDDDESPAHQRITQCVSSQVGCAMGCVFCASGIAGLRRHLSAGEIVAQLIMGKALLGPGEALRQVVFMGMGEPLHNYDELARAIRLITHPDGIALSPRRITVSTVGLVPEIDRLAADFGGQVGLAVSLHHPRDERRSALVPVNRRYPLAELVAALARYPLGRRRRVTIEYALLDGQNDGPNEARALAKLLAGMAVKVNLIPMNPIEHSRLGPPPASRVAAFQRILLGAGLLCFVRRRRGDDVAAACGQLALAGASPNARFVRRQPA
jgi:23S rRNA (adenine2503-C2)-methyltransferase